MDEQEKKYEAGVVAADGYRHCPHCGEIRLPDQDDYCSMYYRELRDRYY